VLTAYSVYGESHTDSLPQGGSVCADGVFRTGASRTQTASLREGLCVLTAYTRECSPIISYSGASDVAALFCMGNELSHLCRGKTCKSSMSA
jgi:hypothetical protein